MVKKVEIFEGDSLLNIKHQINEFLESKREDDIVDVKYSYNSSEEEDDSCTGMVLYKQEKNDGSSVRTIQGGGNL